MTEQELNQIIQAISFKTLPKITKELDKVLNNNPTRESFSLIIGHISNVYSFNDYVDLNELKIILSCYYQDELWLYQELKKLNYNIIPEIDINLFFDED